MRNPSSLLVRAHSAGLSALVLGAAVGLMAPVSTRAAEPAGSGSTELEEVVVTAEKRESTVQKTPISMTALSGAQLLEQGLSSLEDVAAETPGISMKQFSPGQTEYEMRGLSSGGGSSATVGLYLNDVPMTAPAGSVNGKALIDPDLYDLQRVEVLRGPQGTLYGAGSMGGTIKLITAPPEFNKFEGSSQSIVSDTKHGGINWGESAMLNLPLVDDRLAVRLVGTHQYSDGWIDRVVVSPFPIGPGGTCGWATCTRGNVLAAPVVGRYTKSNWDNLDGGRGSLRFTPTDALSVDLMVMYQARSTGAFSQVDQEIGLDALAHYEPFNVESPFRDTFRIASLSINYDMGFAQLTSATGAWSHESVWPGDYSESGQNLTNTYYGDPNFVPVAYRNSDRSKQTSQELRLTSEGSGRFQWLVGAFFSDFESISDQNVQSTDYAPLSTGGAVANPEGILFRGYEPYHIKQYALFAETSYRITDALKATVGLRGFKFDNRLDYTLTGIFALSGNGTPEFGGLSSSNSGVNPKVNLSYEPTQNMTVYGQIAKGFRPGGLNIPAPVPPCATAIQPSYSPDSIWNYEVGEKARLLDGRVTINADVFYIRWNNVQQSLVLACSYPFTGNIGVGESYGPEFEAAAKITEDLTFSLGASYTQAHITSVEPGFLGNTVGSTEALVPGIPVLNVPRYNVAVALSYEHPITDVYKVTGRVSSNTSGPFHDINYYVQQLPGYTLADARIGFIGGPWAVYLFGHNLTNKIAILTIDTHSYSTPEPTTNTPAVTTPRTVGVEVNYKF